MNRKELVEQIFAKKSFLCVGLDTDIKKVPEHLTKQYEKTEDVIFAFNKAIIDATAPYCVSYKPNLAFYESLITLSSPTPKEVTSATHQRCTPAHSSKSISSTLSQ